MLTNRQRYLDIFKFDVDLLPQVLKAYDVLGVNHEQLTLIPPQFECPLPKLSPAVFPPNMREPPPPALGFYFIFN